MDGGIPMRGLKGSCHANPKAGQKFELNGYDSGGLYGFFIRFLPLELFTAGKEILPRCKFVRGIQMSKRYGYKNPFAQKVS